MNFKYQSKQIILETQTVPGRHSLILDGWNHSIQHVLWINGTVEANTTSVYLQQHNSRMYV